MSLTTQDAFDRPHGPAYVRLALPDVTERQPHMDWYLGNPQQGGYNHAKSAFDSAVTILQRELAVEECQTIWLQTKTSMDDVKDAVNTALKEYETRRKHSKAQAWLASCSSKVMHYSSVFDVFVQHHPEYVSLAWGTMKFLFVAVTNHEELITEISKAISKVADVLPRTELHSFLYPTARMQDSVSLLYAKVLEFFVTAIQWYKKGKLVHSISSIVRPFKLSFKPIIDEITERSIRVDELASAASKAEIRDLHLNVHGLNRALVQVTEMLTVLQQQQSLHSQSLFSLQEDHKQLYRKGQVEDIRRGFLLEDTPASDESLAYCRSMRTRRRLKSSTQLPRPSLAMLKAWVAEPRSALLLAQSQGVRTSCLDFAADFLDEVLKKKYPVLWALPSAVHDEGSTITLQGILRSLISQTLALDQRVVSEGTHPVNNKHFKSATSIQQWLTLFERCIASLKQLFLLVDLKMIETALGNNEDDHDFFSVDSFLEYLKELVGRRPQGLKIVVLSWRFTTVTSIDAGDLFNENQIFTDMGRRMERMMRQPKYRAYYRRRTQKLHEEFTLPVMMDSLSGLNIRQVNS